VNKPKNIKDYIWEKFLIYIELDEKLIVSFKFLRENIEKFL